MDVITCDLSDESTTKAASLPYTSQYPLSMYSAEKEKIYYTANAADSKGDELFVMDCNNKETKQLTQYFFAINNIYPIKNGIFIAGGRMTEKLSKNRVTAGIYRGLHTQYINLMTVNSSRYTAKKLLYQKHCCL